MKILTLNTWGVNGPPERRPVLLRAIRELDADIALLQEATDEKLMGELGYPHQLLAQEGWLAIASRYPAVRYGSVTYKTLSPMENYPRQFLLAELATERGPLWAGCTHLSWKAEDGATRLAQAEELVKLVSALPEPLIIAGDFNAPPEAAPIQRMRDAGFTDVWARAHPSEPGITWDNGNPFIQGHSVKFPDRRIDYLFMRGDLKPSRCDVVARSPGPEGLHASDHYGVLAVLEQ